MPLLSPDQHCRSTETIQWKYKNSKDKIVANHQRSCGPVVSLSPAFLKCPTALLVSVHLCSQCSSPDLDYFWSSQLSYRHRKFILLHFNNWTAACMHSRTCTHTHTHTHTHTFDMHCKRPKHPSEFNILDSLVQGYCSVLWHCWLGDRKGIWPVLFVCFSTKTLYRTIKVGKYIMQGQETTQIHNIRMKQYNKPRKSYTLFCLGFLETAGDNTNT